MSKRTLATVMSITRTKRLYVLEAGDVPISAGALA